MNDCGYTVKVLMIKKFLQYKFIFFLQRKNIQYFYYIRKHKKYDLIIFDDIFPHPLSGFRLEEFTFLLNNFKNSKILLTGETYSAIGSELKHHRIDCMNLIKLYPDLNNSLKIVGFINNLNTKLFYCVFLNNISKYIDVLERKKIPFVFTLYPGGGFQMNDLISDNKLKKVTSSNLFQKVIVTQEITKDYLIINNFCTENKIEFIFGGVVPQKSITKSIDDKIYFRHGKATLDICFCAAKYMVKGLDKGYDIFIEIAHLLCHKYDFVKFHIIGGFDESDIDISKIKDKITFYGYQKFENLNIIFETTDIIISPNRPNKLGKGAFDGFPLGTVIEAALNGVLVLLSDELKQNKNFKDKEDVFIIENNSLSIDNLLSDLINNPKKIITIAKNGKKQFQKLYSNDFQMKPRMEVLKQIIEIS